MKLSLALAAWLPLVALAQAPTLTALAPARNAASGPRTGPLALTFSGPVRGAANVRVQGTASQGRRTGTASGDGAATLRFQPTRAFMAGEQVQVTLPATVRGTGAGTPAVASQVYTFRAAAGPATGTFASAGSLNLFGLPNSAWRGPVLADFTNDGKLDMLLGAAPNAGCNIFLGDGQGSFDPSPTAANFGPEPASLEVADFDEDGNLDVVAVASSGSLAVGLGNGRGQLAPGYAENFNGGLPMSIQAGDVNGDGHLDLLFALYLMQFTPVPTVGTTLEVRLGDGLGGFATGPATALPVSDNILLNLADLNNDGKLDVLVNDLQRTQPQGLKAYLGTGPGGFATPGTAVAPTGGVAVLTDLNGDQNLDLLLGNSLRLGTGTGSFGPGTALPAPAGLSSYGPTAAADLDGDGDLDLVGLGGTAATPSPNYVVVWPNNGPGTFAAPASFLQNCRQLALGDLNNDGTMDIVGANANDSEINTRLNTALATAPTLTSFAPAAVPAGAVVTLTGTNFGGATAVLVGGVSVGGFTVVNGTTITFVLPAGVAGGLVAVLTPSGQATSATALRTVLATRSGAAAWPVAVYPNPAHGAATVQVPALVGAAHIELDLCNALGQVVRRFPTTALPAAGLRLSLDVSGLPASRYTVRLAAGGATSCQPLAVE